MDRVVLRDDGLTDRNAGSPQTIIKQVTFFYTCAVCEVGVSLYNAAGSS
jgi:hypothetical protein